MLIRFFTLLIVALLTSPNFAQEAKAPGDNQSEPKAAPQVNQTKHFFSPTSSGDEPGQQLGYLRFLPSAYLAEDAAAKKTGESVTKTWPLMIFLHGAGERGTDLELVKKWGPPKRVLSDTDFPFVLISPQCPKGTYWNTEHLSELIDQIIKDHRIDASRIYLTGLSMGGYGTWKLVAEHPEKFAAAIPICGGGDPATADKLIKTPIWAFHGDADRVVKVESTTKMVEAIKEIDDSNIKMTIYPGVNHNSWTRTYANPKIYDWLLSNTR